MLMGVGGFKKEAEQPSGDTAEKDTEKNRNRNVCKIKKSCRTALGNACKSCKKDNNENIIAGGSGHNELGDTLLCTITGFYEMDHPRNDNSRRYGGEDRSH